jgi:hypothetical protein
MVKAPLVRTQLMRRSVVYTGEPGTTVNTKFNEGGPAALLCISTSTNPVASGLLDLYVTTREKIREPEAEGGSGHERH